MILNAFDSTCDALNGCDFDSDAVLTTDDSILMNNTENTRAIRCVQSKGKKKIVAEEDIIESNKVSFGNNVGAITNRVTSMYAVQADCAPDSEEFEMLEYRKMCGQLYQQDAIDAAKGIIPAKMPKEWYSYRDCTEDGDKDICAEKKPYFLQYRYADLRKKYREYKEKCEDKMFMKHAKEIQDARELVDQEGDCGDG